MDGQYLNSLKELNYASLTKNQENMLKDLEDKFNLEFGTHFYFMVMDKEMNPGH